jgi:hypothetical protein
VPSKPSSRSSIDVWLCPTASLADSGEKLGMDLRIGQQHTVDCVGSHSSREQWACSTLSMTREMLPRTGTTRRKRTRGIHGVLVGFSPAGCASIRITATLRYE